MRRCAGKEYIDGYLGFSLAFLVDAGTTIYDGKKGTFVDLSVLDVLQIFGRAGRPQFDSSGKKGSSVQLYASKNLTESIIIDFLLLFHVQSQVTGRSSPLTRK